jgi:hypothetical protein
MAGRPANGLPDFRLINFIFAGQATNKGEKGLYDCKPFLPLLWRGNEGEVNSSSPLATDARRFASTIIKIK